ncbi:MAG: hypothetical protein ACRCTE_06110 [Cellulosilyticaceae bacterium]
MIGFSIMMWFVAIILCMMAVSLLSGNTSGMHGKAYEVTTDKKGYAKASGKALLFISLGVFGSGTIALVGPADVGIRNALIILIIVIGIEAIWLSKLQKYYQKH